jgi:uncharacterized membrane protein
MTETQTNVPWTLRRLPLVILSIIGLLDSIYLTWIKIAGKTAICANIGDCEAVNSSRYSEIGGIPIALLGAGAYLILLALLVLEVRRPAWGEWTRMGFFGMSLAGTLYSAYLTYIEIAVLKAICPYCVLSAIVLLLLLVLSFLRMRALDLS